MGSGQSRVSKLDNIYFLEIPVSHPYVQDVFLSNQHQDLDKHSHQFFFSSPAVQVLKRPPDLEMHHNRMQHNEYT